MHAIWHASVVHNRTDNGVAGPALLVPTANEDHPFVCRNVHAELLRGGFQTVHHRLAATADSL